jgi:hypothetical protein
MLGRWREVPVPMSAPDGAASRAANHQNVGDGTTSRPTGPGPILILIGLVLGSVALASLMATTLSPG